MKRIFKGLAGLVAAIGFGGAATAETLVGSNIDSRVIVALSTGEEAMQARMPEGWTSIALPAGPLKGANLLLSFVDGQLMLDPDGAPLSPASRRAVILAAPARAEGGKEVRFFVLQSYTTDPETDPYGVNVAAEVARVSTLEAAADGSRNSRETWTMGAEGGDLTMTLEHAAGTPGWSAGEALSHSAANPGFHRIYRHDSLTHLVMSAPLGKPLSGSFSLASTLPGLEGLIDGSEELVAILDIPVRVRKIYLP